VGVRDICIKDELTIMASAPFYGNHLAAAPLDHMTHPFIKCCVLTLLASNIL